MAEEYQIVCTRCDNGFDADYDLPADAVDLLVARVNAAIADGWSVNGAPFVFYDCLFQPMIKHGPPDGP